MTILRLLGAQGVAGIIAALCLTVLLVIQKSETSHWKKQSSRFEQLYRDEQAAVAVTVANYRTAAEAAHAADFANARRVAAEQQSINRRSDNALESRLADARIRAEQLRLQAGAAAAHPGSRGNAPVPDLSAAAGSTDQAARQDRLPPADALTATEQAIQLDELIKWVRAQAKVDNNAPAATSLQGD